MIDFSATFTNPTETTTDCLICGLHQAPEKGATPILPAVTQQIDEATDRQIQAIFDCGDHHGKTSEAIWIHHPKNLPTKRLLLLGLGKGGAEIDTSEEDFKKSVTTAITALKKTGSKTAIFCLPEAESEETLHRYARIAVETAISLLYKFDFPTGKQKSEEHLKLQSITLHTTNEQRIPLLEQAIREGKAIADGISLARTLGNRPANLCTPTDLFQEALMIADQHPALTVTALEEADMEKLGMGSFLSVARGSHEPAKLIIANYNGLPHDADQNQKPIVLVGKGVTFDSGGISLKPGAAMDEMKFDMCGAASVIGTMQAVCELQLPIRLIGLVPATENLPGGRATKPGDVITSLSGKTIEILNTDAEGRLILCDTLTYAERYEPKAVIDIATLTGACVIGLGHYRSGMMSNNDDLAKDLSETGKRVDDPVWRLPLDEAYQKQLDSNFADMANIGGRAAGTITAGCFLSRFTEKYPWVHLDIAGTAWKQGKKKGATGRPVSLLVQYLLDQVA